MTSEKGSGRGSCDVGDVRRSMFLKQMRKVPGAVAIIAAAVGTERTGLAATAWTSLCADPPTILACINQNASAHALITHGGRFSLNLVPLEDTETVAIFSAQRGLNGCARFMPDAWDDGPLNQPLLRSAVVSFECVLETTYHHGTHSILIGRVDEMRSAEGKVPMIYLDGGYAQAVRAA